MSPELLESSLSVPDLTDRCNGIHAINIAIDLIVNTLNKKYGIEIHEVRNSPDVSVKENFDDLLFPLDSISRSSLYTRYISSERVLRTHTTASVSKWLKMICGTETNDIIAIFPGMCYRRDVIDRKHCGQPHQIDVWRIRNGIPFNREDLICLVETIIQSVIPGYEYRINEVLHPYTVGGLEIEVRIGDKWLEVLECGLVHPNILPNAGLNPEECSGLALGMGLDRLVMIAKNINDIRILRSSDPRIMSQMLDLKPYIPVSMQPSTKRVLSYSVAVDETEEDVCEKIREELGTEAIHIEEIRYTEISYEVLCDKARSNLGIAPYQKNVVITLVFRSLEKSLPKELVNSWISRLYPKLNEGTKGYY